MKLRYSYQFLDRAGHLLVECPIEKDVCICFGQFSPFPENRSERRLHQSHAARKLLNYSLRRFFGKKTAKLWQLNKSRNGKPFLIADGSPSISLAHSDNWVACAISNATNIGIDIEAIKSRDWNAYREDVFHEEEAAWVLNASNEDRDVRGLSSWCRKEALVKALGTGMTVPPSTIAFTPQGTLLDLHPSLGSPSGWISYTHALTNKAVVAVAWKN